MAEFIHQANRVLQEAGIPPESPSATALLETLAAHARDWADRAAALGGRMDAVSATRVAARVLVADPELQRRLEDLEAGADALLAKIQAVVDGEDRPLPPPDMPARRRRWGDEAQPRGRAMASPYDLDAGRLEASAMLLIGAPAYRPDGELVGVIEHVMFASGGEQVTGVRLSGAGAGC